MMTSDSDKRMRSCIAAPVDMEVVGVGGDTGVGGKGSAPVLLNKWIAVRNWSTWDAAMATEMAPVPPDIDMPSGSGRP